MRFEHRFTVDQPADAVWSGLLDMERVASCLPGATLEPGVGDGLYRGAISMKVGPMRVAYEGTARLADVDEDARAASIAIKARERGGNGTASATIRNHVEAADGGGSRVTAETDLRLTGRVAQMGGAIVEEVAAGLLGEFARRFERALAAQETTAPSGDGGGPGERAAAGAAGDAAEDDAELELGGLLVPVLLRRAPLGAAVLAALVSARLLRRRRALRIVLERGGLRVTIEARR